MPISPSPIASVTRAPQPCLELGPKGRLAAAGLAGDEHALDARAGQVEASLRGPFDEVCGVGGRKHHGLGRKALDRQHQPLRVPGADRDVAEADAIEGRERRARDQRPGVVGRDDALAGDDARRPVAARRAGHPVVEVAGRERDVARRARRAARRVDPHDLGSCRAEMRADRILRRARRPELALLGERQLRDLREPAGRLGASRTRPPPASRGRTPSARRGRRAVRDSSRRRARAARPRGASRPRASSISASGRLVLDRLLRLPRHQEAERLLLLLGEVGEQAGGAREERHGLHGRRRESRGRAAPPRSASRRSS